jgi:hypothetical protein
MSDFTLDGTDLIFHLNVKDAAVKQAVEEAMDDSVDYLGRIAQNIAPIDKGTLRRSVNRRKRVYWSAAKNELTGTVGFSATEGDFNYAIWTHEAEYNLGEQSKEAPGSDGYDVGNKYLERPLKGEAPKYFKWLAEAAGKEMD